MPKRPGSYRRLRGDSAYYPFGARSAMRRRQRRGAWALRLAGGAALCFAAALLVRQTVFRGGQPTPPAVATAESALSTAESALSAATPHPVTVRPATVDALAGTEAADAEAHASPAPQPTASAAEARDVLPQYQALYEQNPDMVGWLTIDGTDIDYPVMQTPGDNEYYLRRGFDRLYSTGGSLFLDERCRLTGDATANWLIYGHNMSDGSMFGQLAYYTDETFWADHPTFRFDTLTEEGTWAVAAVLRTTLGADELPYYTFFDAADEEEWQRRVDAIMDLALYDTGVTPQYGQQLLTLSTCGDPSLWLDTRLAVLAVRVE